jgi:hypothetical protein
MTVTGWARDASGKLHRTGFSWTISRKIPIHIKTFRVPTETFGEYSRRIVLELWRVHCMITMK